MMKLTKWDTCIMEIMQGTSISAGLISFGELEFATRNWKVKILFCRLLR